MSEKNEIMAPRVHRKLSIYSKEEIQRFSERLSRINSSFKPQKHDRNLNYTILSRSEVAIAYRNSADNSLIRTLPHEEYREIIAQRMSGNQSFGNVLKVSLKKTLGENHVNIYSDRGNGLLTLGLESKLLKKERHEIVDVMDYLAGVGLENKPVSLIIGTVFNNEGSLHLQEEADDLLNSGDYNILRIELEAGSVSSNHETVLIKPRQPDRVEIHR